MFSRFLTPIVTSFLSMGVVFMMEDGLNSVNARDVLESMVYCLKNSFSLLGRIVS